MKLPHINFSWGRSSVFALVWLSSLGFGATIEIISQDMEGVGFNDPLPATPIGGNTATTLGGQRLFVLQHAGDLWGQYLESAVPIRVQAQFEDLGGTPEGLALAGASSIGVELNFANAPQTGVLYPGALANSLAGVDLDTTANDINVTINIAPDEDPALDDWYYGIDGLAPANTIDLLDVLLHEIGHGLGVSSFATLSSGRFLGGYPDVYSLNLFDTESGKAWGDMRNNERKSSAINDPNLVWTGTFSTVAGGKMLQKAPVLEVSSPTSVAGTYAYEPASYGPAVPEGGLTGTLVIVEDDTAPTTDGCETIINGPAIVGNIVYFDRGICTFDAKTLKAQLAGAIAVIIANNVSGGPVLMTGSDIVEGIPLTIPTVSISLEDGQALTGASPGVDLTIGVAGTVASGTSGGYVRIYAPNPLQQGSSVSHWSTDAFPDLLMEPFINSVLREDLDLSLTLLKDIGWDLAYIPFPHLTYLLWVEEAFDMSETLTGQTDDPEGDGISNIEEYFFGGDPNVISTSILPVMEGNDPNLDFTYTRSVLPADLSYAYEVSPDLSGWLEAVEGVDYSEEVVTTSGTTAELVQLKLIRPSTGGKVFARLRILAD